MCVSVGTNINANKRFLNKTILNKTLTVKCGEFKE